jgi:membrane protease YdiL (CAAX protease family)
MLAAGGLLATTLAVQHSIGAEPSAEAIVGLGRPSRRALVLTIAACFLGAALGVLFRLVEDRGVVPGCLMPFALAAGTIGAGEELLYRGYIQGRLRHLGWIAAAVLAALAHTAYKSALFVLPAVPVEIDLRFLALWTFVGGLLFGVLREFSGSVLPPVAAHVLFDLVVYGDRARAPWWVWS